jgi:hypothetical protein
MTDRTTSTAWERGATHDRQVALEAVRTSYETLSSAVLNAARGRGYLGGDAAAAAGVLAQPDPDLVRLGKAVADLWLAFFTCFHPRLAPLDTGHFQGGIDALNQRLAGCGPGVAPDPVLAADLLETLERLWNERHEQVVAQLDALATRTVAVEAGLAAAIDGALGEAGLVPARDEGVGARFARVLAHWRRTAEAARVEARETTAAVGTFLRAVKAVAAGNGAPGLPGEAGAILASIAALDATRRDQERELRALRSEVAGLQAKLAVAAAPPAPAAPAFDEAGVLRHYREALAAFEAGGDPGPALGRARTLERVVTLSDDAAAALVRQLDRFHGDLVRRLEELYKLQPLISDPRRYRPRGLLGLGAKPVHDLRQVSGLVEALVDGAADLVVYAERAKACVGVGVLAAQAPRIRVVFGELVKLVAHWRQKFGDPPPVSVSMSLDGGSGIVALPAVVATDIEAMARKKSKVGPAALVLAPLLEDCVALYHAALAKAGAAVAVRTIAKPRESPIMALVRLSAELEALAGVCEASFAEAARDEFLISAADRALLQDDHPVRSGLSALDEAIEAMAACRGAPPRAALPLASRGDHAGQAQAAAARHAWLTTLTSYRIVIG